jgi:protein-disulfide isomerase
MSGKGTAEGRDLTSASVPAVGPDDHVRGDGEPLVVYADLGCARCAASWPEIAARRAAIVFRHFPVASKHPRSPALHAAAEAAGRQGLFFEMVDSLYADRGRVDDPHLWERAREIGLDLDRFEADRRCDEVAARVRRDFESGIRAGVTGTPAIFQVCTLSHERERQF